MKVFCDICNVIYSKDLGKCPTCLDKAEQAKKDANKRRKEIKNDDNRLS